jgi:hypothetical protein
MISRKVIAAIHARKQKTIAVSTFAIYCARILSSPAILIPDNLAPSTNFRRLRAQSMTIDVIAILPSPLL